MKGDDGDVIGAWGSPPGMELVDGAIDANRDLEGVLAAALPHAVDDTGQPGRAHLGSPRGHALAHPAHDLAVRPRRQQLKGRQDVVDLLAVVRIAGVGGEKGLSKGRRVGTLGEAAGEGGRSDGIGILTWDCCLGSQDGEPQLGQSEQAAVG